MVIRNLACEEEPILPQLDGNFQENLARTESQGQSLPSAFLKIFKIHFEGVRDMVTNAKKWGLPQLGCLAGVQRS